MYEHGRVGEYLYHYTTAEAFFDYILPTMKLRASALALMNDPRESKHWYMTISDVPDGQYDTKELMGLEREFNRVVRGAARVICLTQDRIREQVSPYDRGYGRPRMWSQYAGGHTGVCIALERYSLSRLVKAYSDESGIQVIEGAVAYEDSLPRTDAGRLSYAERDDELAMRRRATEHADQLFFIKTTDWRTEVEYRYALIGDDLPDHVLIPIAGALRGIILGCDFDNRPGHVAALRNVGADIDLGRVFWNLGMPHVLPGVDAPRFPSE